MNKSGSIGIRLEDKNEWERRVPIAPSDACSLVEQGIEVRVESFARRVFADEEYRRVGASVVDDVRDCNIVFGVKEMPRDYFRPSGAYMFFSHTVKGQPYNMEMLKSLVEKKCSLFDYELVADEAGRRLIFFGRFAGLAGMLDTLWTLGQRLEVLGQKTPFLELKPTHHYGDLEKAQSAVKRVGKAIAERGIPKELAPLVFGLTGYGNVSAGAQEILDLLPHVDVEPAALADFVAKNSSLRHKVVKVIYKESDIVEPINSSAAFDLQEYYEHPDRYRSKFNNHFNLLSVLVNCIYWDQRYPKLATAEDLKQLYSGRTAPRLTTVGDITCDIDGSLACTVRDTESGDPVYVYDPETRSAPSGFEGKGLAVMAVGNLPTELPKEASLAFSSALAPYVSSLSKLDFASDFENAVLPLPMRRAAILWRGEFTPKYKYMQDFLRFPQRTQSKE